jgi:putative transposase
MARSLRVEFPGAIYHIISRGDQREAIFLTDQDRHLFLNTLQQAQEKTGWLLHAYCLMSNHFHLALETPEANLVSGMKWFLGVYTQRFNRAHRLNGHLFSGRYKALLVSGKAEYFQTVCDYIHLNPNRAKLVPPDCPLSDYAWSSYPDYLRTRRPARLTVERLLLATGFPDTGKGRRQFQARLEALRGEEGIQEKSMRRGWFIGTDDERKDLERKFIKKITPSHEAIHRRQDEEKKAEALVLLAMARKGYKERDLDRLKKGHHWKVQTALKIKSQTTISTLWLAQRLKMGTIGYASHLFWKYQNIKN